MVERVLDIIMPTDTGYTVKKVGENKVIEEIKRYDNDIPDGVYAVPRKSGEPKVKVRALLDYCDEKGVFPKDLSSDEMKQFLVYR